MLTLISGNQHKIKEWNQIIKVDAVELELMEIQGTSEEIIKYKCEMAYKHIKRPCVVEDVGLEFNGMNGLPGPYIKSFLKMGLDKLYQLRSLGDGTAEAVCYIGYHDGTTIHIFKGVCKGEICSPRISNGFGWDPIFKVGDKSYSEMTSEEKNKISHRRLAIQQLEKYLKSQ